MPGKMHKSITGLLLLVSATMLGQGQTIGIKYFGISLHPKGDPQYRLMPYRLDNKGYVVVNFGGIVSYEYFLYRQLFSIKFAQGFYSDSGGYPSGHTHIGFRAALAKGKRGTLSFGFGPTFIYRKSWRFKEGYHDTGLFKTIGKVQHKFVWYGGEIEYNRQLSNRLDLSVHFLPGYPLVMSFGAGVRYWVRKE